MRAGYYAALMIAMTGLSASPAYAKQYFFCYYWAGASYENRTTVALTKVMETDAERIDEDRLESAWRRYAVPGYISSSPLPGLREATNAGQYRGGCLTSSRRAYLDDQIARYYLPSYRYQPVDWTAVPSDIVPQARASADNAVEIALPAGEPASQPKPAAQAAPVRAELVDTPSGRILMTPQKKAEYEAKLAEHQRLAAERERIIAENAARHAANKAAAQARQAQHEQALANHRETVAQMERDAAARRAEWAAQSAIGQATPATAMAETRDFTVRRVASNGAGSSEESARNELLNGFYKQFGPITNIRCSYIIFNGRREWTCTGDQAVRKVAPQSASGQ